MKKLIIVLMLIGTTVKAQTCSSPANFMQWLSCQQAHAGIGYFIKDDTAKYATTWWDLAQFGKGYGVNVAQPNNSLDYVDIGPATAGANGRTQRWGLAVPVHIGNLWNSIKSNNVIISQLPPVIVSPMVMWPAHASIRAWQWRDFMVSVTYGFGGS